MTNTYANRLAGFFVAGINYRKTDAAIRGQFAISNDQYARLLAEGPQYGVHEFFVVSTCNRTEIYGFASGAEQLMDLLCTQTEGTAETFKNLSYIKCGGDAIMHLFEVGAGLDSQILGDYEIVGQVKMAAKYAKEHDRIGAFTERLINSMLQASKAIKNQTALSGGTVSVSFAAIQYIRQHITRVTGKKILLLGTGKIGRNTTRNLVDYLGTRNITLINRTEEKAVQLAAEMGLQASSVQQMPEAIAAADIILVATSSQEPVVTKPLVEGKGEKLIIDFSIPYNADPVLRELPGITLINVDELSAMKDETLARRMAEVPKAKAILEKHAEEFREWHRMRQNVPILKAVKSKLKEIHTSPLFIPLYNHNSRISTDEKIQRVINGMASKMRVQNRRGCQYIEAINEFLSTGS